MPLTPQISSLSQITFAVSRGISCTGILEFQGKHYDVVRRDGQTQVSELDFSCMQFGLGRLFGRKQEKQHNPIITSIKTAIADGEKLRKQGNFAVLSKAELGALIQSGLDLSNGIFTGCDFSEMELDLPNDMPGGLVAKNTRFKECNFENTRWWVNLDGAEFENCNLQQARFYSISCRVRFADCNLEWASFTGLGPKSGCESKLDGSSFERCLLHHTSFEESSLIRANFTDCTSDRLELQRANLTDAKFCGLNLSIPQSKVHTRYEPPVKTLLNMVGAYMSNTKFERCNLQGMSSLGRTYVKSVIFRETNLGGCDICVQPAALDWDALSKRSMYAGFYTPASPAPMPAAPAAALPATSNEAVSPGSPQSEPQETPIRA